MTSEPWRSKPYDQLVRASATDAPLLESSRSEGPGLKPIRVLVNQPVRDVLLAAWTTGIFTKSNLARTHANPLAEAASRGWITTEAANGVYGNLWLITSRGLMVLEIEKGKKRNDT